jgi:uncharacterized protein (TIGR03437 family)
VASGSAVANFTATAGAFTASQTAVVTASLNGGAQTSTVNLVASLGVSSLQCQSAYLGAGGTSLCSVTLTQAAPSGGSVVALSSSSTWVSVPASVTVPAGSTSATFTAQNGSTTQEGTVIVTASLNGSSQSCTLTLLGGIAVSALTCKTGTLTPPNSTTCTVGMTQNAQRASVTISESVPSALIAPASVIVKGKSESFTVTATGAYSGLVTLSASYAGTSKSFQLSVSGTATKQLTLSCPAGLISGATGQCTVQLAEAAPQGGSVLALRTDNPHLQVSAQVLVPGGSRTAALSIRSAAVGQDEVAGLSVAAKGGSASARISLAAVKMTALTCASKTVQAGESVLCEARLSAPPAAAVVLNASSDSPSLLVPAQMVARARQTTVSFLAQAALDARQQDAVLQAGQGANAAQEHLTLLPAPAPVLTVPRTQFVRPGETLQFTVAASDGRDLPVRITAAGLPDGAAFDPAANTFTWVPGGSQAGSYPVVFTATNSAAASSTGKVTIHIGTGKPVAAGVYNAANPSGGAACSPGSLARVTGGWLFQGDAMPVDPPGVTELGGSRVLVNGQPAELVFASPTRIDFICPNQTPGDLTVSVETAAGASDPLTAVTQAFSPGIFSLDGSGSGQGQIFAAATMRLAMPRNFRYAGEPAQAGDLVALRVTGVRDDLATRVLIGGVDADVQATYADPKLAGVSEIEVLVPAGAPPGDAIPVWLELQPPGGRPVRSNTVTMAIETLQP